MNPFRGNGHDVVAVIQHPGKAVGVAEVVKGLHLVSLEAGGGIQGADGLVRGIHPDKFGFVFGGQVGNPLRVGFSVLLAARHITRTVHDPRDSGPGVRLLNLGDADGGRPDEVGPPVVVPVRLYSQSFPLFQGRTAAHDNVDGAGHSRTAQHQRQGKKKA